MDGVKESVLNFSENHPHLLLAAVVIMVIILLYTYIWPTVAGVVIGKKKEPLSDKEEMKDLIDSIHKKQSL